MSLSKYLQSPEILSAIKGQSPEQVESIIINKGFEWYDKHQEECDLIQKNCTIFGIHNTPAMQHDIKKHIILHYFEKVLGLCGSPQWYQHFLQEHLRYENKIDLIKENLANSKAVLLAVAHFGAIELLAPALSAHHIPINVVLRFSTEQLSEKIRLYSEAMTKTGLFSQIQFIEIGKPGSYSALEMASALRRKEVLISVFDEETQYSKQVSLFGKKVKGGAGLDTLLKHTNVPVAVYTPFIIRTDRLQYSLSLETVDSDNSDLIQQMYNNLANIILKYPEQWYFLHEEIPLME